MDQMDFDSTNEKDLLEIDVLLRPTYDFWDGQETQCLSACCGIDAFAFWKEDIKLAIDKLETNELIKNLVQIRTEIEKRSENIVISSKLNNLMDKTVFIELINHILTTIKSDN